MTTGPISQSERRRRAAGYDFAPVAPVLFVALLLPSEGLFGAWAHPVGTSLAALLNLWAGRRILFRDRDGASPGKRREGLRVAGDFRIARNFTLALAPLSAAASQGISLLAEIVLWAFGSGFFVALLFGALQIFLLYLGILLGTLLFAGETILVVAGRDRIGDRLFGTTVQVEGAPPRR